MGQSGTGRASECLLQPMHVSIIKFYEWVFVCNLIRLWSPRFGITAFILCGLCIGILLQTVICIYPTVTIGGVFVSHQTVICVIWERVDIAMGLLFASPVAHGPSVIEFRVAGISALAVPWTTASATREFAGILVDGTLRACRGGTCWCCSDRSCFWMRTYMLSKYLY